MIIDTPGVVRAFLQTALLLIDLVTQLATEFGYSGSFFAKCNSFLQTIPPSLKTDCPQKRKPVLTRSILGRSLQTYCPQTSWVSCW